MAIQYTEKGIGLHEKISKLGYRLVEANGAWTSDDDLAVQAIINAYSVAEAQERVVLDIEEHAKSLRDQIVRNVSVGELAAWAKKEAEAQAFNAAQDPVVAPLLVAEAAARGVPLDTLVQKVLGYAVQLNALEAGIAGIGGKHKDAVRGLLTFQEILSYDWSSGWPVVA